MGIYEIRGVCFG